MFGGPPIMMSQPYFYSMPAPIASVPPPMAQAAPRFAPAPPRTPQTPASTPRQPVLAEMASSLPSSGMSVPVPEFRPAPAARIRMQAPDEPAPRPLTMPSPEELKISPPAAEVVDWNSTRVTLQQLDVKSFRVDRTASGAVRVCFLMMREANGRLHQIESTASTEAAAVEGAIQETRRWLVNSPR